MRTVAFRSLHQFAALEYFWAPQCPNSHDSIYSVDCSPPCWAMVNHIFLIFMLDPCNSIYLKMKPHALKELQMVKNAIAHLLSNTVCHKQISLELSSQHQVPLEYKAQLKDSVLIFKPSIGIELVSWKVTSASVIITSLNSYIPLEQWNSWATGEETLTFLRLSHSFLQDVQTTDLTI